MIQTNKDIHIDKLIRIALIAAVICWSFVLLYPFLGILAWALIMAIALYPAFNWLNRHLGHRPVLTASLITLLNLFLVVGAVALLTNNLIDWTAGIIGKLRTGDQIIPLPSASVAEWPIIGSYVYEAWHAAATNLGEALKDYSSYFVKSGSFAIATVASKTLHLLYFIISVILSGYLLTQGERVKSTLHKFAKRIAFEHGSVLLKMMSGTIHNVASGVIGITLLQTLCFGVLLLIAATPGAGMLSFIGFILCIAQVGLLLLVIPVIIWLFFTKSLMFAASIGTLLILVTLIDNLLKPIVMSRGLATPMLVIFLGVIGGIIAYGLIGVFIGPVVLATLHNLAYQWLDG